MLTLDYEFIDVEGQVMHLSEVLRACLEFGDDVYGSRLLPPNIQLGPVKGWGTYLPGGGGDETVWRML